MSKESFEAGMKRIFEKEEIPRETVLKDAVDSISMAEIILCAEEELGVELTNERIKALKTYGDIIDLIYTGEQE